MRCHEPAGTAARTIHLRKATALGSTPNTACDVASCAGERTILSRERVPHRLCARAVPAVGPGAAPTRRESPRNSTRCRGAAGAGPALAEARPEAADVHQSLDRSRRRHRSMVTLRHRPRRARVRQRNPAEVAGSQQIFAGLARSAPAASGWCVIRRSSPTRCSGRCVGWTPSEFGSVLPCHRRAPRPLCRVGTRRRGPSFSRGAVPTLLRGGVSPSICAGSTRRRSCTSLTTSACGGSPLVTAHWSYCPSSRFAHYGY